MSQGKSVLKMTVLTRGQVLSQNARDDSRVAKK